MYCGKCGNEIPSDALFCPKCGEKLHSLKSEKNACVIEKGVRESNGRDDSGKSWKKKLCIFGVTGACILGALVLVGVANGYLKKGKGLEKIKVEKNTEKEESEPQSEVSQAMIEEKVNLPEVSATETEMVKPQKNLINEYMMCNEDDDSRDYSFHEGYAWVKYLKYSDSYSELYNYAVIDTEGTLIYDVDTEQLLEEIKNGQSDFEINDIGFTPFENGTSCFYAYPSNGFPNTGAIIINTDGNIIFNSWDNDDTTDYRFRANGEGRYLIEKNTENFSENKVTMLTISSDGSLQEKEVDAQWGWGNSGEYIGEGLFKLGRNYIFNSETQEMINYEGFNLETKVYDSEVLFSRDEGCEIATINDLQSQASFDLWRNTYKEEKFKSKNINGNWGGIIENFYYDSDRKVFYEYMETSEGNGYFDIQGNQIVSTEGYNIDDAGAFQNGYAPIVLTGADGDTYFSLLNIDGTLLYEPVHHQFTNRNMKMTGGYDSGYFYIKREDQIITPDGGILQVGTDDLSSIGKSLRFGKIAEGFARIETDYNCRHFDWSGFKYISLDGTKTIDTVKRYE